MPKKKIFFSISEILKIISVKQQQAEKKIEIIGIRAEEVCKKFKDLLLLCNSISIVFIQFDLITDCKNVLKTAETSDEYIYKHGTVIDKL